MKIRQFTFNLFQENTYVVYDENSSDCAIIDPGCYYPEEEKTLVNFLNNNNLVPSKVLYTHCHLDHSFGSKFLAEQYPSIAFYGDAKEQYYIDNSEEQSIMFGIGIQRPPSISHYVYEGEKITIGNSQFQVLETPGHSIGGVCYYCESKKVLFCGDSLFAGSIGRTDLYGGNYQLLIQSIKTKILSLPDDVTIYCGHGYATTVEEEKHGNPYIS